MRPPTPYGDLNGVLAALVQGIQATLADDFVDACLQGSFAIGGFDEHCDVDFVIAVRTSPDPTDFEKTLALVARIIQRARAFTSGSSGGE